MGCDAGAPKAGMVLRPPTRERPTLPCADTTTTLPVKRFLTRDKRQTGPRQAAAGPHRLIRPLGLRRGLLPGLCLPVFIQQQNVQTK